MPEGPEVKRAGTMLRNALLGRSLTIFRINSGKLLREGVKGRQLKLGSVINDVSVKGKVIFIDFQNTQTLISTLGMSGWWYPARKEWYSFDPEQQAYIANQVHKYTRVMLYCDNDILPAAYYVDPRNFGNMVVCDRAERNLRHSQLGFDLLNESGRPIADMLRARIAHSCYKNHKSKASFENKTIGEILLNQSVIAGIGNIYRAEALYLAQISPYRKFKDLDDYDIEKLVSAAKHTLEVGFVTHGQMEYQLRDVYARFDEDGQALVKLRLSSLSDPAEELIRKLTIKGHLVYGRDNDMLYQKVQRDVNGGRTMWWVPTFQK